MPLPCLLKSPIFCFSVTGECTSVPYYVWLLLDPRAGKGGMALSDPVNSFLMVLPCDSRLSYLKLFPLSLVFECKRVCCLHLSFQLLSFGGARHKAPPPSKSFLFLLLALAPAGREIFSRFLEISLLILDFILCFQRSRHRFLSSCTPCCD
jgi:hypothetical protein